VTIHLKFWVFILGLMMLLFGIAFWFAMWNETRKRLRREQNAHTHAVQRLKEAHEDQLHVVHAQLKEAHASIAAYKGHQTRSANAMLTGKSMPMKPVPKVKEYLIRELP
jgi:ABC-type nickel/cobalt efflux system permease component RcnA